MKVFSLSMMLSVHLHYVLLILSVFAMVCSFPTTPLNNKNQEISWEAWLLVDDQNQNQNRQAHDEHVSKHRIIPKSVFVAPTFSPKDLPPCADGYNSDAMGRCIKIIKLREENQLDFLLKKLNDEFGSAVDYDTVPDEPNSAPTRVDIPFLTDFDNYGSEVYEEEPDMAIIVTPTSKNSEKDAGGNNKVDKRDHEVHHADALEEELKKLLKITPSTTERNAQKSETESMSGSTTTDPIPSTTLVDGIVDSTVIPTTINIEDTTAFEEHGSFTRSETSVEPFSTTLEATSELPSTTTEVTETATLPTSSLSSTTPKITTYHPVATTYHPFFDLDLVGNARTKNFVKFPSEEVAVPRSHPNGNYVRFPDFDSRYQQESLVHHTRDVDDQTGNFFNEIVTPEPSEQIQQVAFPPKKPYNYDYRGFQNDLQHQYNFHDRKQQFPFATTEQFPMKRAKEKFGSILPQKWSPEDIHKPIVLRFSRKHFHFNSNKFKNGEFYRSVPTDDLTYLFGHKNGNTSHR